jgi:hypothetical protein
LPVSALRQWSVKLFVALFAGFVGAVLLPALIVGRLLVGPSRLFSDVHVGLSWLLGVLVLTFVAFWCACATRGTVAAVLWTVPVTMVLGLAGQFAEQWANARLRVVTRGPFEIVGLIPDWLMSITTHGRYPMGMGRIDPLESLRFDWWLTSFAERHFRAWMLLDMPLHYTLLEVGLALILALFQSYRLFRAQPQDSARSLVRNLLPLATLVFLCGFSLTTINGVRWLVTGRVMTLVYPPFHAIESVLRGPARLNATAPLQLTADDVAKAWPFPLSECTRRWLAHAQITVTPDKAHPGGFYCVEPHAGSGAPPCYFDAVIHLADGTEITESYSLVPKPTDHPTPSALNHFSVYIRWPGETTQETLWER